MSHCQPKLAPSPANKSLNRATECCQRKNINFQNFSLTFFSGTVFVAKASNDQGDYLMKSDYRRKRRFAPINLVVCHITCYSVLLYHMRWLMNVFLLTCSSSGLSSRRILLRGTTLCVINKFLF